MNMIKGLFFLIFISLVALNLQAVVVSTAAQLATAIENANSGGDTEIILTDGTYTLDDSLGIWADNVTVRSQSGNRSAVIVQGEGMSGGVTHIFNVAGTNFTARDMTIGWVANHAIQIWGNESSSNTLLSNLRIVDCYEQMVKISYESSNPNRSENGVMENCLLEYSAGIGPQYYIGGIDGHQTRDWTIRNNTFKNIKSPNSDIAEHAIHFWSDSEGTLVENNLIINCDRGIGFGLGNRGHSGGIIRNNMIYHNSTEGFADVSIGLENASNVNCYNNTIYMANSYPNAIEYRFSGTSGGIIKNNLTNKSITARDGGSADTDANITNAQSGWFSNVSGGDLHLASAVSQVVDQGVTISGLTTDYDGDARPQGAGIDIGADEYVTTTPTLTVTSPNGGESWDAGSSHSITWTTTGTVGNVKIEYSTNNGGSWSTVTSSTANDGSYTWTVPETSSSQCLVRVGEAADSSPTDTSDAVFTITTPTTPTITVTSPNGGESWNVGSSHSITWTTTGTVGNVKIEYSTNNGSSWTTETTSTTNDGSYTWTVPDAESTQCLVRIGEAADSSPTDTSDAVFSIVTSSSSVAIVLNRTQLTYGAVTTGTVTAPQTLTITGSGEGTLNWSISDDVSWLSSSPTSGSGSAQVTVTADASGLSAGTYTGTLTVSSTNASNSPQTVDVTLNLYESGSDSPPFGSFDTPLTGTTVNSSIAVTGWALDDIGIESVKIYRDPVSGEGTGQVYIGDAMLVEGARTDVETSNPGYPANYKAGWGYMMLTNFLPSGGNGTFVLYAIATDTTTQQVTLGSKTITCDNDNAVKPFGAIDTPEPGAIISGSNYRNVGWVLTPMPNAIPTDGSTIMLYIDGVAVGNVRYNLYRPDIAALFPGYANSDSAAGDYYFDTTAYANGVHTIAWSAVDDDGNADGIGSRYFTIQNSGGQAPLSLGCLRRVADGSPRALRGPRESSPWNPDIASQKKIRTVGKNSQMQMVYPDETGKINVESRELRRIVIQLDVDNREPVKAGAARNGMVDTRYAGYLEVGDRLRPLPIGSTLDRDRGLFYWQPGPGFVGRYRLVFVTKLLHGGFAKQVVIITIRPMFDKK